MENNVIYDAIQSVAEQTEYNGEGIDVLKNNTLLNAGSVVKSVQRGVTDTEVSIGSITKIDIPIASVNIGKAVCFVTGITQLVNATSEVMAELTNNTLKISIKSVSVQYTESVVWVSWQVIEFY